MMRLDLKDLIRHGVDRGMRVATIPAATERVTREDIVSLKKAGLAQLAQSLDGADALTHDGFRKVPGTFERTMRILDWAGEAGLPTQINTVIHAGNLDQFDCLADLVARLGVVFWEIFFLVPTGRGSALEELTAMQVEDMFRRIYDFSRKASFFVKVTEAPHYNRFYVEQKLKDKGIDTAQISRRGYVLPEELTMALGPRGTIGRAPHPVNSGKGFVFVSYQGDVYPSGFLPVSAGNIRHSTLAELYRHSPMFLDLRNPDRLRGKCGLCPYRSLCGGSRSRAYALSKDWLGEDPWCAYEPRYLARGDFVGAGI